MTSTEARRCVVAALDKHQNELKRRPQTAATDHRGSAPHLSRFLKRFQAANETFPAMGLICLRQHLR